MNTKRFLCAALGAVCCFAFMQAQVRTEQTFEKGWKFTREDNAEFANPSYNDSKWQNVTVPHDWAIYGPFSINNDKQEMAITQDGQTEALEHAGRTGGLPFVGTGWYRLNFDAPGFEKGKKATLIFDGAMSHARVYVNGQEAGYWPYGYNSFYVDATPYLKPGEKNELAVRLENEPESSRWYPGAGLYRNVHLVINEDAHIPTWGTYATTPVVTDKYAKVSLKTSLVSPEGANKDNYRIVTQIKDKNGKVVATGENKLSVFDNTLFEQEFAVANPELWSPETPVLYTAESKVYEGNTLKDEYTTRFGIRTLEIIPDKGFFLNGKLTKFKGVCNHHDLGPLGGAVNDAAIRRQIRILKDMGCNAIRTSHNMPAPELVEACDEMGMMVMAESFDEWKSAKMANGYHKVFDEWVDKDLTNLIRHYRNNPSIVMWCTGNEVPDQWSGSNGPKLSRMLQDICHREDPTRPVTQGMDAPDAVVNNNMAAVMDVAGFNYRPHKYPVTQPVVFSDNSLAKNFNVNSNKIENGQDYAVIPLFDDAHNALGRDRYEQINTIKDHSANTNPKNISFTIKFSNPISVDELNINKLNVFIFVEGNRNQRKEIHIVGYQPTKLANTDLFGGNNDDSSTSRKRYYISKDNLAWGIMVPTDFKWPLEYMNIKSAYSLFESWVTSGGTKNEEWWKTFDSSRVYK